MSKIEIIPIKASKVIEAGDILIEVLFQSLEQCGEELKENDVLVIASKVVAVTQGRIVDFSTINPSEKANKLAKKASIPPEFAEIILRESNGQYIGVVPGAITTINEYGLLANAGADQSNVEEGKAILLPKDIKESAKHIHEQILLRKKTYVGVIIADSRTMPMRLGTVGCALGTYGFEPITDERGKKDLFHKTMHITTRAIADQLATAAELVMGETKERIPFAIIRGYNINRISDREETDINNAISIEQCMFLGPVWDCLKSRSD